MSRPTPHRFRELENGRIERYVPVPNKDGQYLLGDPKLGNTKHHTAKNGIFVPTIEMAVHLVKSYGFSLRMRGEDSGQDNLITPEQIEGI